ncbi:MAG: hypothetical protein HOP05_09780 [Ferruginibacter sp.]|nr:hypothetical protein [Ferruginibacter sp.]
MASAFILKNISGLNIIISASLLRKDAGNIFTYTPLPQKFKRKKGKFAACKKYTKVQSECGINTKAPNYFEAFSAPPARLERATL